MFCPRSASLAQLITGNLLVFALLAGVSAVPAAAATNAPMLSASVTTTATATPSPKLSPSQSATPSSSKPTPSRSQPPTQPTQQSTATAQLDGGLQERAVSPATPAPKPTPTKTTTPTPKPTPKPTATAVNTVPRDGRWVRDAKGWCWVGTDGSVATDVVGAVGGVLYAFDRSGHVARGWYQDRAGHWYWSTDNGVLKGWQQIGGAWYHLGAKGVMSTGWVADAGRWYYLGASGAMLTGWAKTGDGWYYLDGSGAMCTGWINLGGTWYKLRSSGLMESSAWVADGGRWYYLRANGSMATGWQHDGSSWYYLTGNGVMRTGWLTQSGRWYHLGASGAQTYGWLPTSNGKWYYLDPAAGGSMATGWRNANGQRSYFDPWDGFWVTSRASFQHDWDLAVTQYSSSSYLLTVDTTAPHCMAFYWRSGAWQPLYDHPCSVGAPATPTIKGRFRIGNRGYTFGSDYSVYWWTQIYGAYFFHSVLYDHGTLRLQDGRLGKHISHGCVRMRYQDAKWIYDNVPRGTTIMIY